MTLTPLSRRSIGAEQDQADAGGDGHDERYNKGEAPGLARGVSKLVMERVEDDGHDEVGDATTGISEAARQGVCCPDDILGSVKVCVSACQDLGGVGSYSKYLKPRKGRNVSTRDAYLIKEAGRPDLAGHKGSAQNADEESADVKAGRVLDEGCKTQRDGPDEKETTKDEAGTPHVTQGPSKPSHKEGSNQGHNVGVGNLSRGEPQVLSDGNRQLCNQMTDWLASLHTTLRCRPPGTGQGMHGRRDPGAAWGWADLPEEERCTRPRRRS